MDTLERFGGQQSHLATLNFEQREAVAYGIGNPADPAACPPLLVIAGAGSGKTKTLTHRVAHLILNGADPRRILLMTFARRMAAEMTRRVEHICSEALRGRSARLADAIQWSGTFHAIGAKLLRLHAESIGLDPSFSILDRADAEDLMDVVRDELGLAETRNRFPKKGTCLAIYSYCVNAQSTIRQTLTKAFPWCIEWEEALEKLFGAYVDAKQAQGVLDYDDLLLYWSRMMQAPAVAALVAARFDFVLVDEYQDTNALQADILNGLKPAGCGLTVVGDDAQSIYSFRSATIQNILEFPARYEPPAAVVKLEQNYRSTQPILAACNQVIHRATQGMQKTLFSQRSEGSKPVLAMVKDETAQVDCVIDRILANREAGIDLKAQAVLMRASHHSSQLEIELTRRNIPYVKFGGLKFLEAAHVKDVLSVLRWAENPRDQIAAIRILKLLPGIGPVAARRAFEKLDGAKSGFGQLASVKAPAVTRTLLGGLASLMDELVVSREWASDMEKVRRWYDPLLPTIYESAHTRSGDLDQLQRIAAQHATRARFLEDLALDPPQATSAEAGPPTLDEDWLVLSTIHSAKGQEWKAVYILNAVDGCIPSDLATGTVDEIEEERRLLYVAMTRARDELVVMQPMRFYVRGAMSDKHVYAPRTRFIADEDLPAYEVLSPAPETAAADVAETAVRIDLKSAMRSMWRR